MRARGYFYHQLCSVSPHVCIFVLFGSRVEVSSLLLPPLNTCNFYFLAFLVTHRYLQLAPHWVSKYCCYPRRLRSGISEIESSFRQLRFSRLSCASILTRGLTVITTHTRQGRSAVSLWRLATIDWHFSSYLASHVCFLDKHKVGRDLN